MLKKAVLLFMILFLMPIGPSLPSEKSNPTSILDPGHGGNDQGGYDGRGFKLDDGRRVPEDAYTYDVTLRIARHPLLRHHNVFFSIVADVAVQNEKVGEILSHLQSLYYNFPHQKIRVFGGKEGVKKRLEVIRQIPGIDPANALFISIHFDYASSTVSGARIFTTPSGSKHSFVKILAKYFTTAGLALKIHGRESTATTINENLIVLKDGTINPRVLIELGNFNDPRDRTLMMSPEGRELYAQSIVQAIDEYIATQPHR